MPQLIGILAFRATIIEDTHLTLAAIPFNVEANNCLIFLLLQTYEKNIAEFPFQFYNYNVTANVSSLELSQNGVVLFRMEATDDLDDITEQHDGLYSTILFTPFAHHSICLLY